MISKTEETELIKEALIGDQTAFQTLYNRHVDALFAFMQQFANSRIETQEWVQRTFIKAFTKLSSFNKKSTFKTWLFTIGINEMKMDRRKTIHFVSVTPQELLAEASLPEEDTPEQWTEAKQAIKKMDAGKRMVFLLAIAQEYSHKEISNMLNISEGSSRVTLYRAKKELKQMLKS